MASLVNASLILSNVSWSDGSMVPSVLSSSPDPIQLPDPYQEPKCSLFSLLPEIEKDSSLEWGLFVGLPLLWLTLVMVGTILKKGRLGLLSAAQSWEALKYGRQSRLNVLDILRVAAILWVFMNHTGSEGRIDILERQPSAEKFKKAVHEHPVFGALLGNSALGVEVFLVLSGLLAVQSWQKEAEMNFLPHYARYVCRRIARLVPSVFLFVLLASGPLMRWALPRFEVTMISACGAKGLLSHIFFLGNWQEMPICLVVHALCSSSNLFRYLGVDLQLHFAAPFFMGMLNKYRRSGVLVVIAAIAISTFLRAGYCISFDICNKSDIDIPFISYPGVDPATVRPIYAGLWEIYSRPWTKCGPFLVGLLFGWASKQREGEQSRITKRAAYALFFGGFALAVATIYSILPQYMWPDMGANPYNVAYTATFRSVFSLGLVAMIAALTQQKDAINVPIMWSILARLTFAAYLLHMPVVYVFNHVPILQTTDSAYILLGMLPFVATLSFAVALPFHLLIEAPMGRLAAIAEKRLTGFKCTASLPERQALESRQASGDAESQKHSSSSADENHNGQSDPLLMVSPV